MLTAKNLIYSFASSLLVFGLVVAVEQIYLRDVDAVLAASQPPRNAKLGSLAARGSSDVRGSQSQIDEVDGDAVVDSGERLRAHILEMRRNPSAKTALGAEAPASNRQLPAADDRWLGSIVAELANALPFGSIAGAASGPAGVLPPPLTLSGAPVNAQLREVLFSDSPDATCVPGARQFTLEDLRGLYVCVVWLGVAGTYAQQVTFESPGGHVYQRIISAFDTAPGPAGRTVEFDGRAYAVNTAGRGSGGRVFVTTLLPVAGTFITQYNLAGVWTVKVSLNGQVVSQDTFELVQSN